MYYTIVKQTSTVADLEISVLRCVADMLKLIFSLELELQFLQVYHEVASSSQGKMLSQVERLSIVAERLSKFCKEAGLDDFEWTAKWRLFIIFPRKIWWGTLFRAVFGRPVFQCMDAWRRW